LTLAVYKSIVPKLPSNWCKFLDLILSLFVFVFACVFVGGFYDCFDYLCLFLEFWSQMVFSWGAIFFIFLT